MCVQSLASCAFNLHECLASHIELSLFNQKTDIYESYATELVAIGLASNLKVLQMEPTKCSAQKLYNANQTSYRLATKARLERVNVVSKRMLWYQYQYQYQYRYHFVSFRFVSHPIRSDRIGSDRLANTDQWHCRAWWEVSLGSKSVLSRSVCSFVCQIADQLYRLDCPSEPMSCGHYVTVCRYELTSCVARVGGNLLSQPPCKLAVVVNLCS